MKKGGDMCDDYMFPLFYAQTRTLLDFVPFTNQVQMLKMRLLSLNVHPYILTYTP